MRKALIKGFDMRTRILSTRSTTLRTLPSLTSSRSASSKSSPSISSPDTSPPELSTTSTTIPVASDPIPEVSIPTTTSASAYLAAQAEIEDRQEQLQEVRKPTRIPELEEQAWDGDEPQDRAIRRILEDSYKPLRIKGFQKQIPIPPPLPSSLFQSPASPPTEEPKKYPLPWEVTFKAPDSYRPISRSQVYLSGRLSVPTSSKSPLAAPKRLQSALERSKDYEAGYGSGRKALVPAGYEAEEEKSSSAKGGSGKKASIGGGMRGWDGIVEEKIQQAIRDGMFKKVKGRGKPFERDEAESNPFIARDEFLINRIVKSQGAAPPWVDLQIDLDLALTAFRQELRSTWTRRAIRMLSLGGVTRTSLSQIKNGTYKDEEWLTRERAYHEEAVKSINSITRRYNTVAPYSVRKGLVSLKLELQSCFKDTATSVEKELRKRMDGHVDTPLAGAEKGEKVNKGKEAKEEEGVDDDNIWRALRRVVKEAFGSDKK